MDSSHSFVPMSCYYAARPVPSMLDKFQHSCCTEMCTWYLLLEPVVCFSLFFSPSLTRPYTDILHSADHFFCKKKKRFGDVASCQSGGGCVGGRKSFCGFAFPQILRENPNRHLQADITKPATDNKNSASAQQSQTSTGARRHLKCIALEHNH